MLARDNRVDTVATKVAPTKKLHRPRRFLTLVFVSLRRHRLRALIGVAGICFGVAAMLTILSIVNGAIGMFERILAVDSHYLVFEKKVSDHGCPVKA